RLIDIGVVVGGEVRSVKRSRALVLRDLEPADRREEDSPGRKGAPRGGLGGWGGGGRERVGRAQLVAEDRRGEEMDLALVVAKQRQRPGRLFGWPMGRRVVGKHRPRAGTSLEGSAGIGRAHRPRGRYRPLRSSARNQQGE